MLSEKIRQGKRLLHRAADETRAFLSANRIILGYPTLKIQPRTVNLHYYRAEQVDKPHKDWVNLGDYLSQVVVRYMLRSRGLGLSTPVEKTSHLYAIGSIMLMGYQNATVWGSGLPYIPAWFRGIFHRYRSLDIRAVRGPLTRKWLVKMGFSCPTVYGDPAILMPLIYQPTSRQKTREFIFIPHYQRERNVPACVLPNNVISMNTMNYAAVIDAICSAKMVISSSLHGIILAESYGVPAVFYQDAPVRFSFKYEDWYASTKRSLSYITDIKKLIAPLSARTEQHATSIAENVSV